MPITNQPNLAALQAAIVQAINDSQTAVIANSNSNAAAVVTHVTDETGAAATETQSAISDSATATQAAVNAKGVVKSIQRGEVYFATNSGLSQNITISAVNTAKAFVMIDDISTSSSSAMRAALIDSTTVTVYRLAESSPATANWQVIEYE